MARQKTILIVTTAVAAVALIFLLLAPRIFLGLAITHSISHQSAQLESARPRFDTLVRNKLKVGDTVDDAKKVLSEAGLEFTIDDERSQRLLRSVYHAGEAGAAFRIEVTLDGRDRISKIDIQDFIDVP
jgi:hypothetical protein